MFFTHLYGKTVSNPVHIEENFETLYQGFNGTSFESTEHLLRSTNLNKSELIEVQTDYLYEKGVVTGAKVMMAYPISAVVFSGGSRSYQSLTSGRYAKN